LNITDILAEYGKYEESYSTTRTFHDELKAILLKRKWDSENFKERTGLDDMTFTRLTKKPDYRFSKRIIVNICIGLGLDFRMSEQLLKLQGYSLSTEYDEDNAYSFLIERGYTDIEDCNRILTALKIPPKLHLGTLSKQ